MKNLKLLIILLLLIISNNSSAQTGPSDNDGSDRPKDQFYEIRSDVATVLVENRQLAAEHSRLAAEYQSMLRQIADIKKQIDTYESQLDEQEKARAQASENINTIAQKMEDVRTDFLLKKSRNTQQKGDVLDTKETRNLWQLKMADLEYQKNELELELQLKEPFFDQEEKRRKEEIEKLKQQIQATLEQIRKQKAECQDIEQDRRMSQSKIETLKKETADLSKTLAVLKKETAFRKKKNDFLREKKKLERMTKNEGLLKLKAEQKYLSQQIETLRRDYDLLNNQITESLAEQKKDQETLNDIKVLTDKNQELTEKVEKLKSQLNDQNKID